MEFGKRHDSTDFYPHQLVTGLLRTCYGEVDNLLSTCYRETGVMDLGLISSLIYTVPAQWLVILDTIVFITFNTFNNRWCSTSSRVDWMRNARRRWTCTWVSSLIRPRNILRGWRKDWWPMLRRLLPPHLWSLQHPRQQNPLKQQLH